MSERSGYWFLIIVFIAAFYGFLLYACVPRFVP